MNLIFFGFQNAGKSTLGKKCAEKLSMPFIDTDALIEKQHQLACREIYKTKGKEHFRAIERQVILSLAEVKDSVISVGGGAVLDPHNAAFLQTLGTLIYLKIDKEMLYERLSSGEWPAYLDAFEPFYEERKALYEALPAFTIAISQPEEEILWQVTRLAHTLK